MSGTSGPTSPTPFAYYDPDSSSLKTSQGTFPWDSMPSSPTLPPWGSMRGGELFELPTSERATNGPDSSSLLPTPTVVDMGERKTVGEWDSWTAAMQDRHGNGNGHGPSLSVEARRLLPTPEASDGSGGRRAKELGGQRPSGAKRAISLATAVDRGLLPTPTTLDYIEKRTTHAAGNPTVQGALTGLSANDQRRHGMVTDPLSPDTPPLWDDRPRLPWMDEDDSTPDSWSG